LGVATHPTWTTECVVVPMMGVAVSLLTTITTTGGRAEVIVFFKNFENGARNETINDADP
jgi:hypothetical protein